MAYKRTGLSTLKWKRWVAEHRQELINSGVPQDIYRDQARWLRFLAEGGDCEKQWSLEMLRVGEAKVLHTLLESNREEFDVSSLLHELQASFEQ